MKPILLRSFYLSGSTRSTHFRSLFFFSRLVSLFLFLFPLHLQFTFPLLHQDDAFAAVKFDLVTEEALLDILGYHLSTFELTGECGSLIEMADGKDTRTLCNKDKEPVFQKGWANSRAVMPQFDPTAGIAVCGDATVYVIDSVLIPKDYFVDEEGEVVEDNVQEVIDAPDPNDGKDYFKELLIAKGTVTEGSNTCANTNPQFPNINCLGEDGTVDVGPQGMSYIVIIILHTSFTIPIIFVYYYIPRIEIKIRIYIVFSCRLLTIHSSPFLPFRPFIS